MHQRQERDVKMDKIDKIQ